MYLRMVTYPYVIAIAVSCVEHWSELVSVDIVLPNNTNCFRFDK